MEQTQTSQVASSLSALICMLTLAVCALKSVRGKPRRGQTVAGSTPAPGEGHGRVLE